MGKSDYKRRSLRYEKPLDLGLGEEFDVVIPPEQLATDFLVKYKKIVDPQDRYSAYFLNSGKSVGHIYRDVKRCYIQLVLESDWTEKRLVMMLEALFEGGHVLSPNVLMMIDDGRIAKKVFRGRR